MPLRASAKITVIRPAVATASLTRCAPVARWCVEIETAAAENITLAVMAPAMHPRTWTTL